MKRYFVSAYIRYFFVLALFVSLALLTASNWASGLIVLLVILPIVSWGMNFYVKKNIEISLSLPNAVAKNNAIEVNVVFSNGGFIPVMRMLCILVVSNELTGEKYNVVLPTKIGAKKTNQQAFLLESGLCGQLRLYEEKTVLTDFLGLLPIFLNTGATNRTTILPELFGCDLSISAVHNTEDESSANKKGEDRSELYQLREYRNGDDVRQIHWKLSSKIDDVIIREPGTPQSRSLLVFWDKRSKAMPEQMDSLADTTVSICQSLINVGMPFALSWTDGEELQVLDISDEDSLLQAIPMIVRTKGEDLCPMPEFASFGKTVYISAEPIDYISDKIIMLLCSDKTEIEQNVIAFTPTNYKEVIQRLEI